ncbi:MAG: F0F1 ATP synthase subunit delta [Clostridiales bacterium]|nr:F0F1 ATP synthase subunit delta [Clostridiales bacterium]
MTEQTKGTLQAVLSYVTAPSPQQLEGIRAFLQKKYACQDVELTLREDKSLVSGFTLQAGADEYDCGRPRAGWSSSGNGSRRCAPWAVWRTSSRC